MPDQCQKLVDSYVDWLRDSLSVVKIGDVCEVTTPFLDRHNDRLQIYIQHTEDGVTLSDDSYILADLEACGCGVNTPHRKELLQVVLNGFGISVENGELFVRATEKEFPRKKHSLLQAMMAINDMFMTGRHKSSHIFLEDVSRFLDQNSIRFTPNVEFTGRSGFTHRYDFVIPRSPDSPERLIRAINNPSKDTATQLIFSWTDTKRVRPQESNAIAILNDTEKSISADVVGALNKYKIQTVLWSERAAHLLELAA